MRVPGPASGWIPRNAKSGPPAHAKTHPGWFVDCRVWGGVTACLAVEHDAAAATAFVSETKGRENAAGRHHGNLRERQERDKRTQRLVRARVVDPQRAGRAVEPLLEFEHLRVLSRGFHQETVVRQREVLWLKAAR